MPVVLAFGQTWMQESFVVEGFVHRPASFRDVDNNTIGADTQDVVHATQLWERSSTQEEGSYRDSYEVRWQGR